MTVVLRGLEPGEQVVVYPGDAVRDGVADSREGRGGIARADPAVRRTDFARSLRRINTPRAAGRKIV